MSLAAVTPPRLGHWLAAPTALCLLATLLLATPVRVWGLQLPEPVFSLVPAFAWAAIRPSILPPFALLLVGLAQDLLWGASLGFWPLCLLSAYGLILLVRSSLSGQGFITLWGWYAAACALAFGVGIALTRLQSGVVPDLIGVVLQGSATIILFPLAYRVIERYEAADARFR